VDVAENTSKFIFNLPNSPEELGVALAPSQLRRLDFSALDFDSMRRAGIEYIRTYFPDDFNDFFASNGVIMTLELVSYLAGLLSQRGDVLIDEAFLPTAQTKQAVIQHLQLIGQKVQRATPATVNVTATVELPLQTELRIPAGTSFTLAGPDLQPLTFEIFRAPGDFVSPVVIPTGKRGTVAFAIEGRTETPLEVVSQGGPDQFLTIGLPNVLDEPIDVVVSSGSSSEQWRRADVIGKASADDPVFEVRHLDVETRIVFGDDRAGRAPLAGQRITVTYRTGGGVRGRIGTGTINESRSMNPEPPSTAAVQVTFTNPEPSTGGLDEETIEQAKRRAPREFATQGSAVTGEDYALLAQEFNHPVFGSVAKAVGVVRTGVDQDVDGVASRCRAADSDEEAAQIIRNEFINRNIVELFALSNGPDNVPVAPSVGLKKALVTFFESLNVLTDEVRVFDGAVKPVNVKATIVMSRNADAGAVRVAVENAIHSLFDIRNFDMGTGLFVSHVYGALQELPGVRYVDVFEPADDIIQTNRLAEPGSAGIGINEIIVLGSTDLKFFFEPGNFKIPPIGK